MNIVIDKLREVLASQPGPVLSSDRIGTRMPENASDVPAVAATLSLKGNQRTGLGRFIRSGDSLVEHTAIIEATPGPDTFAEDLQTLRISPLPLRRNPSSSVQGGFTENDIQILNVSDATSPIQYRMINEPKARTEFHLEVPRAEIIFGAPQTPGDKLQLVHWTVTLRNEIQGDSYQGLMQLDIWANSANEIGQISAGVQSRLASDRGLLREKGFIFLSPARLEAAENVGHTPPIGSPFSVWKQKLGYRFAFEAEAGGEISSGVPIRRIDVDLKPPVPEEFSIPFTEK